MARGTYSICHVCGHRTKIVGTKGELKETPPQARLQVHRKTYKTSKCSNPNTPPDVDLVKSMDVAQDLKEACAKDAPFIKILKLLIQIKKIFLRKLGKEKKTKKRIPFSTPCPFSTIPHEEERCPLLLPL